MSLANGKSRKAIDNREYSARRLLCAENGSCSTTIKSTSESGRASPRACDPNRITVSGFTSRTITSTMCWSSSWLSVCIDGSLVLAVIERLLSELVGLRALLGGLVAGRLLFEGFLQRLGHVAQRHRERHVRGIQFDHRIALTESGTRIADERLDFFTCLYFAASALAVLVKLPLCRSPKPSPLGSVINT